MSATKKMSVRVCKTFALCDLQCKLKQIIEIQDAQQSSWKMMWVIEYVYLMHY